MRLAWPTLADRCENLPVNDPDPSPTPREQPDPDGPMSPNPYRKGT